MVIRQFHRQITKSSVNQRQDKIWQLPNTAMLTKLGQKSNQVTKVMKKSASSDLVHRGLQLGISIAATKLIISSPPPSMAQIRIKTPGQS